MIERLRSRSGYHSPLHSIRFRLTVLYSTVLFTLAAVVLLVTYLLVSREIDTESVQSYPVIRFVTEDGRKIYLGTSEVVEVDSIETVVKYKTLRALRNYSLSTLGGLFLASLAIGWVVSGRALRPVRRIARAAAEIQATDLSRRIALRGPNDELRYLADTIDSMLDRLDAAFRAQRQLIDDVSHELRTPLAIIRANLDAVLSDPQASEEDRRRAVAVVDRATSRMTRLVEDLLATARRSASAFTDTDVDLAEVAAQAGEEFAQLAQTRGISLRYATSSGLTLIADPDALRRAVGNLLSNALRVAPTGSEIVIGAGREKGWLWLAVADAGPGIADEDQPRVFDRFWRGRHQHDSTERHTGLGLAIVRQIAESHGGQVRLFSQLGVGSTFVLWLPAGSDRASEPVPPHNPLKTKPAPRSEPATTVEGKTL